MQRYESYKPSGVKWLGDVPAHWEVRPGFTCFKENKDRNKGLVENTVLSLSYGRIVIKPEEKLTGLVPESFESYQLVKPGDIVIRTTDLQNDQTSLRVGYAKDKGMITSAYLGLRCHLEINPEYVFRLLESYDALKVFYGMGSGLRQNIDFWDFKRLPVPLPPRDEQDRIVAFLDQKTAEIDAAIAKKERLIELLESQKQSLIYQATTQGIQKNKSETQQTNLQWLEKIPSHWKILRLKSLATFITSGPRGWSDRLSDEGPIFVQSGNLNDSLGLNIKDANRVSVPKGAEAKRTRLQDTDVVICITGANTGRVAVADIGEQEAYVNQHLSLVRLKGANSRFVAYSLSAPGSTYFYLCQYGLKEGLSLFDVANAPVALPPLAEQDEIVRFLDDGVMKVDRSVVSAQNQIVQLQEFKRALISASVIGKLKV